MPHSPNKRCNEIGCNKLVPYNHRHCAAHRKKKWQRYEPNRTREGFYNTAEWKQVRDKFRKANPMCAECARHNESRAGYVIDHIVPINKGGARLDPSNLQNLCAQCHQRKRGKERHGLTLNKQEETKHGTQEEGEK